MARCSAAGARDGDERCELPRLGDHEQQGACSGVDISSFEGVTPALERMRLQRVHLVVRLLLLRGEMPVIASVEGHAAAVGLCLRYCRRLVRAKFFCTFNQIGLFPDLGAAWTLPRWVGLGRPGC
jgi:2-(1,2-epoxy-1,2-dihydrophenyl)acetyl-CoA isomerase